MREFSVRFRVVMNVDARISKLGYHVTMRIETEANRVLEIRAFAFDDELMVEVPRRLRSPEYARSPSPPQARKRGRNP